MAPGNEDPINRKYRAFIESTYSTIPKDADERVLDNLTSWAELAMDKRRPLKIGLEELARLIFRNFDFREVGIGLKSKKTETFRYEVLFGYRREIVDSFLKLEYTMEDMVSQDRFPFIKIGRLSELNPVEGLPAEERNLFNRPYQLEAPRESQDDFLEGDYIDVWMYGPDKELIGWLELAGPTNGKLPSKRTIRWMELIATLCSSIIVQKWADSGPQLR